MEDMMQIVGKIYNGGKKIIYEIWKNYRLGFDDESQKLQAVRQNGQESGQKENQAVGFFFF